MTNGDHGARWRPANERPPASECTAGGRHAAGVGASRPVVTEAPKGTPSATPAVGGNLRRLRSRRGLSLERLAQASGVSRAMLGQVELGRSTPTISVLWKIARALEVPFSALITDPTHSPAKVLRAAGAKVLTSYDGAFVSRALFPSDGPRLVEFYELRLAPTAVERAEPHPPGTKENLVVAEGSLRIVVAATEHRLSSGDAILFEADVPHEYWNDGNAMLRMFLVMTYTDVQGR